MKCILERKWGQALFATLVSRHKTLHNNSFGVAQWVRAMICWWRCCAVFFRSMMFCGHDAMAWLGARPRDTLRQQTYTLNNYTTTLAVHDSRYFDVFCDAALLQRPPGKLSRLSRARDALSSLTGHLFFFVLNVHRQYIVLYTYSIICSTYKHTSHISTSYKSRASSSFCRHRVVVVLSPVINIHYIYFQYIPCYILYIYLTKSGRYRFRGRREAVP